MIAKFLFGSYLYNCYCNRVKLQSSLRIQFPLSTGVQSALKKLYYCSWLNVKILFNIPSFMSWNNVKFDFQIPNYTGSKIKSNEDLSDPITNSKFHFYKLSCFCTNILIQLAEEFVKLKFHNPIFVNYLLDLVNIFTSEFLIRNFGIGETMFTTNSMSWTCIISTHI